MMWSINWASLSFASWLLLRLCIWGTVSYVGLTLILNAVETLTEHFSYRNSKRAWLSWRVKNARARRQVDRWTPRVGMLVLGYVLGQAQFFSPIRELHDVAVLGVTSSREFDVAIPARGNAPRTSDTSEHWKLCSYGDDLPLRPGMVMTVMQYKQRSGCLLIDRDTEVKYLHDSDHNVIDRTGHILFAKEE